MLTYDAFGLIEFQALVRLVPVVNYKPDTSRDTFP